MENKRNKSQLQLKNTTLGKQQIYVHIKRNLRYLKKNLKISEVNIKHVIISFIYIIYIKKPVCSREDIIKN